MRIQIIIILIFIFNISHAQFPEIKWFFSNHIHTIDEPVFYVDSAYGFRTDGSQLVRTRIFRVGERDNEGRLITGFTDKIKNDEIEYVEKRSAEYNADNELVLFSNSRWNQDSARYYLNEKQCWDDSLNLTEDKWMFWLFTLPQHSFGQAEINTYDVDNNLIERSLQRCSWKEIWYAYQRYVYQFDSLNMLLEYVWEDWNNDSSNWEGKTKWEYFYDQGLNTYCYIYSKYSIDTDWVKIWKREHFYDSTGVIVKVKYLRPINDTTYVNYGKWCYVYNKSGMVINQTDERYDTINNEWENYQKLFYEYQNDTSLITYTMIWWTPESSYWRNVYRASYNYNNNGKLVHRLYQGGDSIAWKNRDQDFLEYDEYGNIISLENQKWKYDINHEGYWAPQYREEYFWPGFVGEFEYVEMKNDIIIYPNPVADYLSIVCKSEIIKSIQIFNLLGVEVYNTNEASKEISLDMSSYPKGTYLVNIRTDSNTISKKVIIQRN